MAPHNSTLLQSQFAGSSPELVSQYSPILPRVIHSDQSHHTSVVESDSRTSIFTDVGDNQWQLHKIGSEISVNDGANVEEEIPIWIGKNDIRYVSGVTSATTCNDVISVLIQDEIQSKNYSNIEGLKQEVDDYIIVEKWRDVEAKLDGDTRILPLFVAWGTLQSDEVRFRLKINRSKQLARLEAINVEKKVVKKDKVNILTKMVKRVLKQGDYIQKHLSVLKEKRERNIANPKFTNKMFTKKLFYETCRSSTHSLSSSKCSSVERLYCKCCQNLTIKNKGFEVSRLTYTNNLQKPDSDDAKTDDELLLILDAPPKLNVSNETLKADSGNASGHSFSFHEIEDDEYPSLNNMGKSMNVDETPAITVNSSQKRPLLRSKSYKKSMKNFGSNSTLDTDPIVSTPKRKQRTLKAYEILRQHSLNKKLFASLSHLNISDVPTKDTSLRPPRNSDNFDSIRFEIMMKMSEMKQLLVREEMLLTQIQLKCAHYKAENEAYNSRLEMDIHVEEIQINLESCAEEIIRNEQELFKTKLEVERKAKVLQDLKGLLQLESSGEEEEEMIRFKIRTRKQIEHVKSRMSMDQLNFIDDIYEFCDGNKSMIV